ncbi:glucagon family neuropeptides-like [Lethenteron reissneri]|uniref:glucagon family neuropeptides-like n=1 Tax=Lethenteron reissneri TaxID=7753 RepID=UPI002AB64370|nr:glucagon family neuropeptides-like [Lethenteron reissneri]
MAPALCARWTQEPPSPPPPAPGGRVMARGGACRSALLLLLLGLVACASPHPWAAPTPTDSTRSERHADGLFTSGYRHVLGQMSARRYMDGLVAARLGYAMKTSEPVLGKRQADAIFTNGFSRYRHKQAASKLLLSLLESRRGRKHSLLLDNPPPVYGSSDTGEFQKLKEFIQITLQMSGM